MQVIDAETEKQAGNELFQSRDFEGALVHYDRAVKLSPYQIKLDDGGLVYAQHAAAREGCQLCLHMIL